MVRFIIAAVIAAGLAACQAEEPPTVTISSQNINDTRIAKNLFGVMPTGSAQASQPCWYMLGKWDCTKSRPR